ncbi:type I-C CRISPR-associated protein Cas8c/Csd1 [Rhodothermaceae bacterium RA]|nr:type I-C CRISPR-associated protein Cas8c/Csd1 [Rhodothermaceae bacterium RA]
MILERLRDLHARLAGELVPAYHKKQRVPWILALDEDGRFLNIERAETGKKDYVEIVAPTLKRTSGTRALLFVDKPSYALGRPDADTDKARAQADERHTAYRRLAEACALSVHHPATDAFLRFLDEEIETARAQSATAEMKPGDLIAPRVGETFLTDLPEVRAWWQNHEDERAAEDSTLTARCMLCGEEKPIVQVHPVDVRVGPDAAPLVSANKDAFESYGLSRSEIAPMCQRCARMYGETLAYLLKSPKHHLFLGGLHWIFWTREDTGFDVMKLFTDPDEEQVRGLLRAPQTGTLPGTVRANDFYALAVTSNKRMVVRSWLTMTVDEAQHHLARYFERQRLLDHRRLSPPLKLLSLAGATVRDLKDLSPQVVPLLLEHALTGHPLPLSLLHRAVQRARADGEHPVTRPRAALIKLVLLSQPDLSEERMVHEALTPDHPSAAYQCGRLLAVLDDIQRNAISPKATLVDRFYGSASATPASVFGVLLRKAQAHLGKLRKEKPGLHHHFEQMLGEIMSHFDGFPRTLSLEEQGLFAIGFYQQKYRPRKTDGDEPAEATAEAAGS